MQLRKAMGGQPQINDVMGPPSAESKWSMRPSVGTWLVHFCAPARQRDRSLDLQKRTIGCTDLECTWSCRPSVGTWLGQLSSAITENVEDGKKIAAEASMTPSLQEAASLR